jgi:hypothetical protein
VARVTVVGISVAEPKRDGTAELALKVDVVCTVFITILNACPNRLRRALGTYEFLWLEILKHILSVTTINHTSEIRILALVALVVSQFKHRKLAKFVEVMVLRV